jgi:hypothetical protein
MGIRSYESSFELNVVVVLISMFFVHSLRFDSKIARRCECMNEQSGHAD